MEAVSDNKELETRGCLSLNDKVYPVYDGHNTVGRSLDAIINIKHLNVSKHHAVITIVDHSSHYLSDFKSSNGTILDNKKLTPLQLYKLNDGASIKFGDVFCTYKKLGGEKKLQKCLEETQEFSESFYGTATQEVTMPNLPEGINFNELPTQIFANKDLGFNEMATQIHELVPQDDSSNDSIDFMTMQKAAESQAVDGNSQNGISKQGETPSTQICSIGHNSEKICDSKTDEAAPNGSQTRCSPINPVGFQSRQILDDDLTLKPTKTAGKNVIDSDSDTEEYDAGEHTKSKYVISDDSETDIDDDDDDDDHNSKVDENEKDEMSKEGGEKSVAEENLTSSSRLAMSESTDIPNEEVDTSKVKVSKKTISVDHVYCQFTQTQNQSQEYQNQKKTTDERTDGENDHLDTKDKENKIDKKNEQSETKATTDNDELPTQKFDVLFATNGPEEEKDSNQDTADRALDKEEFEKNASPQIHEPSEKDKEDQSDDVFLQPTQTLDIFPADKNDEIFLQPTQTFALDSKVAQSAKVDEIFFLPTQTMKDLSQSVLDKSAPREERDEDKTKQQMDEDVEDTPKLECVLDDKTEEKKHVEECSKEKKPEESGDRTKSEDEDTPNLDFSISEEATDKIHSAMDSLSDLEDSIFPPTQEPSTSKKMFAFNPFKVPSPLRKKKLPDDDDSFLLQPTQALEVLHDDGTHFGKVEDELHELFASQSMLCTQQLVDVLNTTAGEIIDDSIQEDTICRLSSRKSEPLTTDSVKKILEDPEDVEEKEVRTYLSKERKSSQKESIIQDKEAMKGAGNSEKETRNEKLKDGDQNQITPKSLASRKEKKTNQKAKIFDEEEDTDQDDSYPSEETVLTETRNNETNQRSSRKKAVEQKECPQRRTSGRKIKDDNESATDEIRSVNTRGRNSKKQESVDQKEKPKKKDEKANDDSKEKSKIEKTPDAASKVGQRGNSKIENSQTSDTFEKVVRRGRSKMAESKQNTLISGESVDQKERTNKKEEEANDDSKEKSKKEETTRTASKVGRKGKSKTEDGETNEKDNKKKDDQKKSDVIGKQNKSEESSQKSAKTDSQSSRSSERISRRSKEKNDDSQIASKSEIVKKGKNSRKANDVQELVNDEKDSENGKDEDDSEKQKSKNDDSQNSDKVGRRGKRKKIEDESQNSNEIVNKENTTKKDIKEEKLEKKNEQRSGRRKQGVAEEESFNDTITKLEEAGNKESAKRTSKRKKNQTEDAPTTPTKKRATEKVSSPMKRLLKLPSDNSEDDFVQKVPILDTFPKKGRQSARRGKNENDDNISDVSDIGSVASTSTPKKRRLSANSRQQKREENEKQTPKQSRNESILPTSERSRRQLKPKVVFTMMDNPELESLIRQLGGSVVDTVDACTVLVTETVKRSQKLLTAVAHGKPICSPQWLYACKKAFSFLDPWDYILVDKEAEKKWKFSLKESLERSSRAKLLEDYSFQLIVDVAADVLKGAIEACGGKCVTRNLPKCDTQHLIIVSSEKNKSKYSRIVKQNNRIKVVEPEAIFDGTLRQEFRFDQFLLT